MNKMRIIRRMLCAALIVMTLVLTAAPALASSKNDGAYVVTTVEKRDRLRVRSSPWGDVKTYLKKGTVVVYKSSKSGWWYVQYRGGKGYVDRTCLTSVSKLSSKYFVPVDNLWVRTKPKTNAAKVKMKKGTKVKITGQKGTWVKISYKGRSGWVPAIYLKRA